MDWSGVRRNSVDLIDLGEPPPQLARLGDELDLLDAILGGMLDYATNSGNNTNRLDDVENSFFSDVDDNSTTNLLSSRMSDMDLNDNCNLFDDHDRLSQILNSRSENHDANDVSLNFVDNINYNSISDNVSLLARSPSIRHPELLPSGASLRRSSRRRSQRRTDNGGSTSVTNTAATASSSSQSHRRSRSTGEAVNVKAAGKRRRSSSISATGVEDDMSLKCERAAAHTPVAVAGGSPPDWLRISMRRVRPFRLGDPSQPLTVSNSFNDSAPVFLPSAPPATDLDIVGDLGRPSSAPLVVHHNRQPQQHQQQNQLESRGTLSSSRRQIGRRRQPPVGSISADNTPVHQPQQTRQNWTQQEQQQFRQCPVPDIVIIDHEERWRQHRLNSDSDDNGSDNESDGESLEQNEEIDSPSTRSHHHEQEDGHITNPVRAYEMTNDFQSPLGQWSHGLSSLLACLGCTLGIFNISSFALYSVQFGANFILQFLIMSLVFGIPLFTLHLSLGQLLAAGTVDMWRISPIFQGIGIAILTSQAFLGVYSIIGVSWMLVYFRDSFITKQDVYRWAEPYTYRDGLRPIIYNSSKIKLEETVADYLNGVVLQRHNLEVPASSPGHLKFQVTFNLIVVWMIVFICLSKGLRSYGKVVYLFSLVPIFGMFVLSSKLLGLMPTDGRLQIITNNTIDYHRLPETDWGEFFLNTKSWMAASSVSFCTWGLLSAASMQITSHNNAKHVLHRDASLVIITTLSVLLLSAFLANTCHQILFAHGYAYIPSSFERMSTYGFLQPIKSPPSYSGIPVRWMTHSPFLIGDRVIKPNFENFNLHRVHQQYHHLIHEHQQESGYQVLRFATELVPATLAIIGPEILSPFWSVLFYFILIMFGIAQQLAIWHCLITGIMAINVKYLKSWETTITFFTCAIGFILGLPMATELGIFVVYFLDYVIGGSWWIMLLYMIEIIAVFVVRGRPYSGETVVATLFSKAGICAQTWLAPLLSFTWNVILPTILLVLCMTVFKNGKFRYFYKWSVPNTYEYWPSWSRQLGFLFQSIPIMTVPFIAIIQTCRYLSNGPTDIFDRIQLLYRPQLETMIVNSGNIGDGINMDRLNLEISANGQLADQATDTNLSSSGNSGASDNLAAIINDPPPKYTPPPSYSTATGARIARMLRQSFRRSVRRIHHVFNNNPGNGSTSSSNTNDNAIDGNYDIERRSQETQDDSQLPPPPEYSTILDEMNNSAASGNNSSGYNSNNTANFSRSNELSANQVATLLRSSFRRGTVMESISSEHLVNDVAPISQDSVIVSTTTNK